MRRRGFTIVELLMVIGIIAVLSTIVTTAASGAMKQARGRRADALVQMIQAGIATYHAQNDEWPDFNPSGKSGNMRVNGQIDPERYLLTDSEADNMIRKVVRVSAKNPLIDVTGLYVAKSGSVTDKTFGMDFMLAMHGTKKHPQKVKVSAMTFGYPDRESGRFRRFKIVYSIPTDQITVSKQ